MKLVQASSHFNLFSLPYVLQYIFIGVPVCAELLRTQTDIDLLQEVAGVIANASVCEEEVCIFCPYEPVIRLSHIGI